MTRWHPLHHLRALPGALLLLAIMVVSAVPAALLSWRLLTDAEATGQRRLDAIANALMPTLIEAGLSGLRVRIARQDTAFLAGTDIPGIAFWRLSNGTRTLFAETEPGLAETLSPIGPGQPSVLSGPGGPITAQVVDVAARTGGAIQDVDLRLAIPFPGPALVAARQTLLAIWISYGFVGLVGVLVLLNNRRHYRAGLDRINIALADFSSGTTAQRVPDDLSVPELAHLSGMLNPVLGKLEDLISGLRHISGIAAHEMKIPITKIRIDLEKLTTAQSPEDTAAIHASIRRQIDRALEAFSGIMLLFRVEADRNEALPDDPVDLSDLVDENTGDMEMALEAQDRRLTVSIAPGVFILGDRRLMIQVIVNLLENARRYAPPGAEIAVRLSATDNRFRLSVANSGGGFPADVRESAFDRFAQSRRTDRSQGSGLGLNLVRAIAERHGFTASITPSESHAEVVIEGRCVASETSASERINGPQAFRRMP